MRISDWSSDVCSSDLRIDSLEEAVRSRVIGRDTPGHVHHGQGYQSGIGNHQMKGQSEHRRHIMGVQPTALPFAEPQHEEISKDLLVRDDARQDGDQHEHRGGTDEITRPEDRNIMQVEMEAVQEETTGRVTRMDHLRSEEHTSELQSLMRISYAVFCLKKKIKRTNTGTTVTH